MSSLQGLRFKAKFAMSDVFVHIIVWTVISFVTFGIGLVFWPYASVKLIVNAVAITDDHGQEVGSLRCDLNVGTQVGHAILWYLLSLITFGLALPFYFFGVARMAIEKTTIATV